MWAMGVMFPSKVSFMTLTDAPLVMAVPLVPERTGVCICQLFTLWKTTAGIL
jgi:hypothetical protein